MAYFLPLRSFGGQIGDADYEEAKFDWKEVTRERERDKSIFAKQAHQKDN